MHEGLFYGDDGFHREPLVNIIKGIEYWEEIDRELPHEEGNYKKLESDFEKKKIKREIKENLLKLEEILKNKDYTHKEFLEASSEYIRLRKYGKDKGLLKAHENKRYQNKYKRILNRIK